MQQCGHLVPLTSTAWSSTSGWQPRHTGCARNMRSLWARNACTRVLSASGSTACPEDRSSNCRMKLQKHRGDGKVLRPHVKAGSTIAAAQRPQARLTS